MQCIDGHGRRRELHCNRADDESAAAADRASNAPDLSSAYKCVSLDHLLRQLTTSSSLENTYFAVFFSNLLCCIRFLELCQLGLRLHTVVGY